jgi:hypothetical protein
MNETLPNELDGFQRDLERAVERDLHRRRAARRVRATAAGVVAAGAVTAGALLSFGGGVEQPLGVAPADAAQRAAAALQVPRGTVLHVVTTAHVNDPRAGAPTGSWTDESWQLTTPPYRFRQIERGSAGAARVESESAPGVERLYDPARDTVYELQIPPQPKLRVHLVSQRPCVEALRWQDANGAWQADNVDCGTLKLAIGRSYNTLHVGDRTATIRIVDVAGRRRTVRAATVPVPQNVDGGMNDPRAQVLAMLRSGRLRMSGSARIGDRAAIRLAAADGDVYFVDAKTYVPIELRAGVTTRFETYEVLPGTTANRARLSIEAQHPDARVVEGRGAYLAAEQRLYPDG